MPKLAERLGRPGLSRERVLAAGLAIADESGLDALTMRSVAVKLGSEAMSLYRHVRDKDDLLDGMVDLVYAELSLPARTTDWRKAMRAHAISTRDALLRHRWAAALMESRARPGPANLGHHDAVVGALRAAGFTPLAATRAYNVVDSYVYGFAIQAATLPFGTKEELAALGAEMLRVFPADAYPNLRAVMVELIRSGFEYADEFELGLDVVLDGLERMHAARRARRRRRSA